MKFNTDDLRITGMEEVVAPDALIRELPLPDAASRVIFDARHAVADAVHRRDDRLIVVIGPCSIHDPIAAREYAQRLAEQAQRYSDQLLLVMRVYFEKPRTTVGWKGLINDPDLNDSYDINKGLRVARQLLVDLANLGVPAGTEYLDPISPQYIADLVSWGAIGARTTESQVHRELASGLSCPIGFKNSTAGNMQVAVDAIRSAAHAHIFLSVTKAGHSAIFSTHGNEDCHVILRGGSGVPNHDAEHVAALTALLEQAGVETGAMIDFSHANSAKRPERQLDVCADVAAQIAQGNSRIVGVMLESNLVGGRQDLGNGGDLVYGQSITDACLGWEESLRCFEQLADAVERRRASLPPRPAGQSEATEWED